MKRISQLPAGGTPTTGDLVAIVKAGVTSFVSVARMQEIMLGYTGMAKNISGDLNVAGNQYITGGLNASGTSKLGRDGGTITYVIGNLRISGNEHISGFLTVTSGFSATGRVDLGFNHTSITRISGNTTMAGTGIVNGPFMVYGSGLVSGLLSVLGNTTIGLNSAHTHIVNGKTTFVNPTYFSSTARVTSTISGDGDILAVGRGDFGGHFGASGNINLGILSTNVLYVRAKQVSINDIHAYTHVNIGQNLRITGELITLGLNTFGDSLVDTSTFNGEIIGNNGMQLTGVEIAMSGLSVRITGNVKIIDMLTCSGNVGINNNLQVNGKTNLGNDNNDQTHIYADAFIGRHTTITGDLNLSGVFTSAGAIRGSYVKKIKFNPSIRACYEAFPTAIGRAMYYQGVGTPGNILGVLNEGTAFTNVVVLRLPAAAWHTDNYNYASGDYIYLTGIDGAGSLDFNIAMPSLFKGVRRLIWASTTGLKFDLGSQVVTFPLNRDNGTATGTVAASNVYRPMIMASWKPSQAYGVTGVIGIVHGKVSQGTAHWKILYDKPFSNNSYMVFMTAKQRGLGDFYASSATKEMVIAGISSGDNGLTTETIITMDQSNIGVNATHNAIAPDWLGSVTLGDESPIIPREFHFKAEEF